MEFPLAFGEINSVEVPQNLLPWKKERPTARKCFEKEKFLVA